MLFYFNYMFHNLMYKPQFESEYVPSTFTSYTTFPYLTVMFQFSFPKFFPTIYRLRINYRRIMQNHIFTNIEQKYTMLLPDVQAILPFPPFGGNGSIAWTSAVSHVGRTSKAFTVTMKPQIFLFQMVVTSCTSIQYL